MRRVSGASSHRLGLEAALSVLERWGRATTAGLSKVHCFNCEVTATSTMVAEEREKEQWQCSPVVVIYRTGRQPARVETKACRSYAPMVGDVCVA
jgi:hypothetical protein